MLLTIGSPRVVGDDEEDDVDDLENEFNYMDRKQSAKAKARQHLRYNQGDERNHLPQVPLLTNTSHVSLYHTVSMFKFTLCSYTLYCNDSLEKLSADIW